MLLLLLSVAVPVRESRRGQGGGWGGRGCGRRDLSVADLALLQELLRVQRVERPQVLDHVHELREDGRVLGMLREQDAAQDLLETSLHLLHELGVAEAGAIWSERIKNRKLKSEHLRLLFFCWFFRQMTYRLKWWQLRRRVRSLHRTAWTGWAAGPARRPSSSDTLRCRSASGRWSPGGWCRRSSRSSPARKEKTLLKIAKNPKIRLLVNECD